MGASKCVGHSDCTMWLLSGFTKGGYPLLLTATSCVYAALTMCTLTRLQITQQVKYAGNVLKCNWETKFSEQETALKLCSTLLADSGKLTQILQRRWTHNEFICAENNCIWSFLTKTWICLFKQSINVIKPPTPGQFSSKYKRKDLFHAHWLL